MDHWERSCLSIKPRRFASKISQDVFNYQLVAYWSNNWKTISYFLDFYYTKKTKSTEWRRTCDRTKQRNAFAYLFRDSFDHLYEKNWP